MAIGIVGRKRGMTRLFEDEGGAVPVTVIEAEPNRIAQVKTRARDGYDALQVTTGSRRPSRVSKPEAGHVAATGVEMGRSLWELRCAADDQPGFEAGQEVGLDQFQVGQLVDVTGRTKGKGFAGTIKRHNFRAKDNSHGNSKSHRTPGSIGQAQDPGRVLPGKRMAGHLGDAQRTTQNLRVVRVDAARNLLLVRGAIPGSKGADVIIRPAIKALDKEVG